MFLPFLHIQTLLRHYILFPTTGVNCGYSALLNLQTSSQTSQHANKVPYTITLTLCNQISSNNEHQIIYIRLQLALCLRNRILNLNYCWMSDGTHRIFLVTLDLLKKNKIKWIFVFLMDYLFLFWKIFSGTLDRFSLERLSWLLGLRRFGWKGPLTGWASNTL